MTLTGGPATGLAFAPLFEQAGVAGRRDDRRRRRDGRHRLRRAHRRPGRHLADRARQPPTPRRVRRSGTVEVELVETEVGATVHASSEDDEAWPILKNLVAILVAMWIGAG